MSEEAFYALFAEKLRRAIGRLPAQKNIQPWAASLYLARWHKFQGESRPKAPIVACDGSMQESSFSGGLGVCVVRAVAHIYEPAGEVVSVPDVEVDIGYALEGQSILMKTLELKTLRAAMAEAAESGGAFAVYDGSLYLTLTAQHMQKLKQLADKIADYVGALTDCLRAAQRRGVNLVGMSKDSSITYLRTRIILEALMKANPKVGGQMGRERSMTRMARKLKDAADKAPSDTTLKDYLDELTRPVPDEGVYSEIAPDPGFTTPLLLGPQTQFLSSQIGTAANWWESAFRTMLETDKESYGRLLLALDAFYSEPPIALTYWKPKPELGVYRLDIPSNQLSARPLKAGDMAEDRFVEEDEAAAMSRILPGLASLGRGPHIVTPLTEVDAIVRLDQKIYKEAYEPIIEQELQMGGFNVKPRRRTIRDLVMRGY